MKRNVLIATIALMGTVVFSSCQREEVAVTQEQISDETLNKIYQLGFGTKDVQRIPEGYLVEGDIVLTEGDLNSAPDRKLLRVGETEQYHTNNLVYISPGYYREIKVSISSALPSSYRTALDEAIRRYNAQDLSLTFRRVSSGANISITKAPNGAQYLASAGFPTSSGNPYNSIVVNSGYLGSSPGTNYLATILAHEIGHCIGFRHTDYADRSYSCGGKYTNEGASTVGAEYIPGTAYGPDDDATSWMLACVGTGANRPFNANDVTALRYLYY